MLSGKKLVVGVTGSIAAYKSATLVRELVRAGAEVRVVMTESARDFISALTLSTLSKHPVQYRFTDDELSGEWNNHVELGLWADALLIAPLSANTLAKMCTGVCDNLLMATFLSAKCPTIVAPAMDLDMYLHPTTKANLKTLMSRGVEVIESTTGELASGLHGQGRMEEPEEIRRWLEEYYAEAAPLSGLKALVTAGPTYEDIDPVRFLGNRSSGKMGFALAESLAARGAEVTLVSGPTALLSEMPGIQRVDVRSAAEMKTAVDRHAEAAQVIIMAAAVADYRPAIKAEHKIKKGEGHWSIDLERTEDILAGLGERKQSGQLLIGFALESTDGLESARGKLKRKNLDAIVLNSLQDSGAGFAHDTNRITIIDRHNNLTDYELKSKRAVADDIVDFVQHSLDR